MKYLKLLTTFSLLLAACKCNEDGSIGYECQLPGDGRCKCKSGFGELKCDQCRGKKHAYKNLNFFLGWHKVLCWPLDPPTVSK